MAFIEIEQKYRLKSPLEARVFLKRLRAKKVAQGREANEIFDKDGFLGRQKVVLRLRRFCGKTTLTLKGPRLRDKFSRRMEIETPVNDGAAKAFLDFLGCRRVLQYIKKRELYRLGAAQVAIDFLPKFGWFLEIEGPSKMISQIEKKLELSKSDREEKTYLQMLFGIKH